MQFPFLSATLISDFLFTYFYFVFVLLDVDCTRRDLTCVQMGDLRKPIADIHACLAVTQDWSRDIIHEVNAYANI